MHLLGLYFLRVQTNTRLYRGVERLAQMALLLTLSLQAPQMLWGKHHPLMRLVHGRMTLLLHSFLEIIRAPVGLSMALWMNCGFPTLSEAKNGFTKSIVHGIRHITVRTFILQKKTQRRFLPFPSAAA